MANETANMTAALQIALTVVQHDDLKNYDPTLILRAAHKASKYPKDCTIGKLRVASLLREAGLDLQTCNDITFVLADLVGKEPVPYYSNPNRYNGKS